MLRFNSGPWRNTGDRRRLRPTAARRRATGCQRRGESQPRRRATVRWCIEGSAATGDQDWRSVNGIAVCHDQAGQIAADLGSKLI